MEDIKNKVVDILKKYTFNISVWEGFSGSTKIISELKINSARIVDIILDVEDEFGITVEDDLLDKIVTIDDVVNMIASKLNA